jgi:site-specific DNA recombinase
MSNDGKPQKAILWPRISFDKAKDEHGVNDQEYYLREFAGKLGWGIGYVIKENDTSASARTRKVPDGNGRYIMRTNRPVLQKILRMIENGETDGIIVRDIDRALRDPRDLEDLIEVCASRHPFVPVESITGRIKLRSIHDAMGARIHAAIAKDEADKIAERVTNTKRLRAFEGKYRGGPRPYGFEPDGITLRPSEARVIADACDAVLDGESLSGICRALNRRGIPVTGKTNRRTEGRDRTERERSWGVVGLRQILMRPRNAGLIDRHGEIVGTAAWPAIVPEEKWRAVCAILNDPTRRVSTGPKARHLGSNIYYCGVCLEEDGVDAHMVGQKEFYHCKRKNHFNRRKAPIDELVVAAITDQLADPDSLRLLRKTKNITPDAAALSADSANIRRQLRELDESYNGGRISIARFEQVATRLEQRLAENDKAVLVSLEADPLEGIAGNPDAATVWDTLSIERQRAILRIMLEVVIYRPDKQPNQHTPFDPQTVWIGQLL